ncbi:hypothetical protein HPB50_023210 [Hyalomma asiaticum]|uniref:Uncharacterized protein n=1 Tax=Hyalomma asiaticum TaxID=266040 RepID=A0ACB7SS90_HYAAI|nr:hypothetical protein HPB50_023210 [Hyalomma asiaticum]
MTTAAAGIATTNGTTAMIPSLQFVLFTTPVSDKYPGAFRVSATKRRSLTHVQDGTRGETSVRDRCDTTGRRRLKGRDYTTRTTPEADIVHLDGCCTSEGRSVAPVSHTSCGCSGVASGHAALVDSELRLAWRRAKPPARSGAAAAGDWGATADAIQSPVRTCLLRDRNFAPLRPLGRLLEYSAPTLPKRTHGNPVRGHRVRHRSLAAQGMALSFHASEVNGHRAPSRTLAGGVWPCTFAGAAQLAASEAAQL